MSMYVDQAGPGRCWAENQGNGQEFYYENLTTQTVTVVEPEQFGWLRIRIWVCPSR